MAIEITKYMELTGLTEGAAKGALSRGDEYASWSIPGGAAKLVAKDAMEVELEADETNAGTIVVEKDENDSGNAGAGEGSDEGDGPDLDEPTTNPTDKPSDEPSDEPEQTCNHESLSQPEIDEVFTNDETDGFH